MASKKEIELIVRNYLDREDKNYRFNTNSRGTLFFTMQMQTHVVPIDMVIVISDYRICFEAVFPTNVTKKKYEAMCQYLMLANNDFYSKFEMDFDDGQVKAVEATKIENISIDDEFISDGISSVFADCIKVISGFMKILYSNIPCQQAMEESKKELQEFLDSLD